MAVEKSLTVRDYLEPRNAGAARPVGAERKGPASFQNLLKSQPLHQAENAAAGIKISDYLKNPVMKTQTARSPKTSEVSVNASAGIRSAETLQEAKNTQRRGELAGQRIAAIQNERRGLRSSATSSQGSVSEKASANPIETSIHQAAAKYNLSPELIRSVIRAESNFQPEAVSPAGAKGLMQLMPDTAKDLGVTNPFDIQQNVDGGARYLRQMLDRFGGDLKRALAAYNAGPGAVEQFKGDVPFSETRQYVQRVLRYAGLRA